MHSFLLHDGKLGAALAVRVEPCFGTNEIAEVLNDGTVKIRLNSATNDAGLNRALLDFLSSLMQVSADQMEIVAGENGLDKLVSIINLDASSVQERITRKTS